MSDSISGHRVGGRTPGKLKKGAAAASIPSRYQTILGVGEAENTGFGSASYRFSSSETDGPAPGQYHSSSVIGQSNPSHSAAGFGAMASKSRRGGPRQRRRAPGPGEYDMDLSVRAKKFTTVSNTSSFAPDLYIHEGNTSDVPGPGDYDPSLKSLSTTRGAAGAVSLQDRSKRHTEHVNPSQLAPGPGEYEQMPLPAKPGTGILHTRAARLTAEYGSEAPGPGAYDVTLETTPMQHYEATPAIDTAQYRRAQRIRDRLETQKSQLATAPRLNMTGDVVGDPLVPPSRKPGVKMSTGPRFTEKKATDLAPGPAWYSPSRRAMGKQSFRLNTGRNWA